MNRLSPLLRSTIGRRGWPALVLALAWLLASCTGGGAGPLRSAGLKLAAEPDAVLFASDRSGNFELWAMRPDGSSQTQLTAFQADARQPLWSPDGSQVAFVHTSDTDNNGQVVFGQDESIVYVLDLASGELKKALSGKIWQNAPMAWSPDGKRIAAALIGDSTGDGQRSYLEDTGPLVIADVATGQVQETGQQATWGTAVGWGDGAAGPGKYLLFIAGLRAQATLQRLDVETGQLQSFARGESLAVSPDRLRVAYGLPHYEPMLTVAPVEQTLSGNDTVAVVELPATFAGLTSSAWSPDGARLLAATFQADAGDFDYAVVSLTEGVVGALGEKLAQTPQSISWAPDSQRVLFSAQDIVVSEAGAQRSGQANLYLWSGVGVEPLQLTNQQGNNIDPAWKVSP